MAKERPKNEIIQEVVNSFLHWRKDIAEEVLHDIVKEFTGKVFRNTLIRLIKENKERFYTNEEERISLEAFLEENGYIIFEEETPEEKRKRERDTSELFKMFDDPVEEDFK